MDFSIRPQAQMDPVMLSHLLPYLDDWNMGFFDPCVSDFTWSMDDSRRVESISKDLSEDDQVDQLQLFVETNEPNYQHRWRTSAPASSAGPASPVTELTGKDPTINVDYEKFRERVRSQNLVCSACKNGFSLTQMRVSARQASKSTGQDPC